MKRSRKVLTFVLQDTKSLDTVDEFISFPKTRTANVSLEQTPRTAQKRNGIGLRGCSARGRYESDQPPFWNLPMISHHKRNVIILVLILMSCISCSSSSSQLDQELPASAPGDVYYRIQDIDSEGSLEIIEVAGSYEEIGRLLGEWYQDHGFIPRLLSEEEKQEADSLLAFYETVNPFIVDQMRGMYAAFGLELDDLQEGILVDNIENAEILLPGIISRHSCSVVFVRPEITSNNHPLLGRNYDFPEEVRDLTLLFSLPTGGYPTAILTPRFPGLIAADGINNHGLALGFASVTDVGYDPPPGHALISSIAYRYVLEQSTNVNEAVELLQTIPIVFVPSSPEGTITHLLLADKSGASAVVEFLPEGVVAIKSENPFQVMTNNLWVAREERESCQRYCLAVDRLEKDSGNINTISLMTILADLRSSTQYSVVYDLQDLTLRLSLPSSGFSAEHEFSLIDFMDRVGGRME
jgi:predicted choloylglycine hydrolase